MVNRKQIAIDFANSLNHPEIEKIILFGSVAREEDTEESDIDILIITKSGNELEIKDDVYTKVMDIVYKHMEYISAQIISLNHYKKYKDFSFYSTVDREGIILG